MTQVYTQDDFVFFWGGECSQWHRSQFVIDKVTYNCAEQYMMHQKALHFNDALAAYEIMETKDPREQKAIGRMVKDFDPVKWNEIARLVVYRGNFAKFTQNTKLLDYLVGTGDKWIVEASPEDVIWGIGMAFNHPDILDPTKWKGKNWLGEAYMQVRSDINTLATNVLRGK